MNLDGVVMDRICLYMQTSSRMVVVGQENGELVHGDNSPGVCYASELKSVEPYNRSGRVSSRVKL